jgi:hypothetical protein
VLSVALLVGRGVERRLREEQILTFQALPFILFPHTFHKDKLRQSQTEPPEISFSARTLDKHRTRRNSNTKAKHAQSSKDYLFSSLSNYADF